MAIAALAPAVLAAGILHLGLDARAEKAAVELDAFQEFATAEARKARAAAAPPYIAPMWRATLSPAHRARIETMELNYHSLLYRRGITGGFATGGTILLAALGAFWWWLAKRWPSPAESGTNRQG